MSRLSYLALLRRTGRPVSARVAAALDRTRRERGFVLLYDSPTLTVLAPASIPHLILADGTGVALGWLFDPTGAPIARESGVRLDQPPAALVETVWGGYLALRTRHAAPEVLRDPSGMVPCYHAQIDDVHLLAAEPRSLVDLGLAGGEVDWTVLRQALVFRDLRPTQTALCGIVEIQPGVAARVFPTGLETECAWSPWTFTSEDREIADPDTAVEAVRRAVTLAVGAWSRCFRYPLVEISGGLDSAIVAAVLAPAAGRRSALTFRAVAGDTDETPYARAIADHLGIEIDTLDPDLLSVDIAHSAARDLARPNARSFAQAIDRPEQRLAERLGADAYFSGGGGDNVFSYLRSLAPVVDRLRREGPGRAMVATMADVAALGETSLWTVMARTGRRVLRRAPPPQWISDTSFLAAQAAADLPLPGGHPWLPVPRGALPGKRAQVMSLIRVQNHLDGHGRLAHAPIVFPLLSQPVMEACLAVPSWLWCAGGRNRAVARAAFAGMLPASVIARQSKGAFDSLCVQTLQAHHATVREQLLAGSLAREGLLDRAAIERALDAPVLDGRDVMRLLMLADVEAWVRGWAEQSNA